MTERKKRIPPNEFVALLGLLNRPSVQYPPELLAARRAGFIAQVKAAQPTSTGDTSIKGNTSANTSASQILGVSTHVLETVLQYVLAAMVVVLISTLAYIYRDKLLDLITGEATPEVQIVDTPVFQPATEITIPSETATEPPTSAPAIATPKPDEAIIR